MALGSWGEDETNQDGGGIRPYNHFYDPLSGLGLSDLPIPPYCLPIGNDSFTWASVLDCPGWNFVFWLPQINNVETTNAWSWQNVRYFEMQGLTNPIPASRWLALENMWQALGHVLHLLQDTSQPQHARNEQHLDKEFVGFAPWRSPIEKFGLDHVSTLKYTNTILDWKGAGFTKMRDFWDRDLYVWDGENPPTSTLAQPLVNSEDTNQPASKLGLAEFVNGNFIGDRHSYWETTPAGPFRYPLPSLYQGTDFQQMQGNPAAYAKLTTRYWPNQPGRKAWRFIVGKTGQGRSVTHHGAIDYVLARVFLDNVPVGIMGSGYVNDPDVLQDYHDILIPEAIKYSSGLLDYYFRGMLAVSCPPCDAVSGYPPTWTMTVTNISGMDFLNGAFHLYYDDPVSGLRTEILPPNFLTTYTDYLANGATITANFTAPSATQTNYVLLFQGTIGVSNSAALDPVDAGRAIAVVAFKTPLPPPSPPPTCGLVSAAGQAAWPGWFEPPSWLQGTYSPGGEPCWLSYIFPGILGPFAGNSTPLTEWWIAGDARGHTRYLTKTVDAYMSETDPGGESYTYTLHHVRTLDGNTGVVVAESITESQTGNRYCDFSRTQNYTLNTSTGVPTLTPYGPDGCGNANNALPFTTMGLGQLLAFADAEGDPWITASLVIDSTSLTYTASGTDPLSGAAYGGHFTVTLSDPYTLETAMADAAALRDTFNLSNLAAVYTWAGGPSGQLSWGLGGTAQWVLGPGQPKAKALTLGSASAVCYSDCAQLLSSKLRATDDGTGGLSCLYSQEQSGPTPSTEAPYNSSCTTEQQNGTDATYNGTTSCSCVHVGVDDYELTETAFTYGSSTLYRHGCDFVPSGTCCNCPH